MWSAPSLHSADTAPPRVLPLSRISVGLAHQGVLLTSELTKASSGAMKRRTSRSPCTLSLAISTSRFSDDTNLRRAHLSSPSVCSAVRCGAVKCSAVRCSEVQCSAVQCSAVESRRSSPPK